MARIPKSYDKELGKLIRAVARNLKAIRVEGGVSQNELARRSKVALSTINELENEVVSDFRMSTIVTLAKTLGCGPLDLLGISDLDLKDSDRKEFEKAVKILSRLRHRMG